MKSCQYPWKECRGLGDKVNSKKARSRVADLQVVLLSGIQLGLDPGSAAWRAEGEGTSGVAFCGVICYRHCPRHFFFLYKSKIYVFT